MAIAKKLRHLIPAEGRVLIKKKFPELVEKVAIGVDLLPSALNGRAWKRLLQPNPNQRLHHLSSKMWCGFGERTAKELELSKLSDQRDRKVLASTAWSLAKWYAFNRDYGRALENLILMTTAIPRMRRNAYTQLMIVECLLQLDRPDEARDWLQWASRGAEPKAELCLSAANISLALARLQSSASSADAERLSLLNQVYEGAGFSKIEKMNEAAPLTLGNITVPHPRPVEASAKLSVLMPAYNCADTLPTSLISILNQTWRNLEVLVVDDRSQDDTWQVIERFAQTDSRVIPLRHERNGGAYAARNTALAHATGEFVTVHDADDWSHPEKFAAQMLYATSHPESISTTIGVRVSSDLQFDVKANMAGMLMENTSSLLLRRQMLVELGGWDQTRMGADSELYERVKAKHKLITNKLFMGTPLTLILFSGSSLTQTKAAGLATVNYGARRQYKEAYRFWHASELAKPEPDLRMTETRRFPAPRILLGQKGEITDIDLVIVGNFADAKHSTEHHIAQWDVLARAGLKLGLAHWPSYRRAEANIASPARTALAIGLAENIVPGEAVLCTTAIVLGSDLLNDPPHPLPSIQTERLYVVTELGLSDEQHEAFRQRFGCAPVVIGSDYAEPLLAALTSKGLSSAPT
ncbi:glycosyltransferase family 2 protein [Microvirga aerilata]|uniref:Glycosyltransferase family 2 protein n=1 Tax=Microvirga aerilata TaxID=670292 RepID=A0A937CZS5_9HYPH|nr:glycosyltransferase family A protein [Microvirga aerilata]MBL0405046.1 glycosyltransferase family 2 protein [Microvirga aerilata]